MTPLAEASAHTVAVWLFTKILALCYLAAFASLIPQVRGLWGSKGILPVDNLMKRARAAFGRWGWMKIPTLFWWCSKDWALSALAYLGVALSVALLAGAPPTPLLVFLWLGYLSYVVAGEDFLSFQWDILLLEIGFFTIFLTATAVPTLPLLLLGWFILFRFMFSSGMVKVLSRCPAWRSLTAMDVHYETQPLPTRWAWWAHQQPSWMGKVATLSVFFVEIVLPFLFFAPPPIRFAMAAIQIVLQLGIIITGNYAFFNILTIGMCVLLIDNGYFPAFMQDLSVGAITEPGAILIGVLGAIAAVLFVLNALQVGSLFLSLGRFAQPLRMCRYWYLCNPYGLFARMTTERNEIILEGSEDGEVWKEYVLPYKPQDVHRAPRRVAPHQPRLDWQMWFAALGRYDQYPWFQQMLVHLLEGTEQVTTLFEHNPFPEGPPKFVRAQYYRYRFSDRATYERTGQWWVREHLGLYCPSVTIQRNEPEVTSGMTQLDAHNY